LPEFRYNLDNGYLLPYISCLIINCFWPAVGCGLDAREQVVADKKVIAILIYPGFSLLELVGAVHVWESATAMSAFQTVVVGTTTGFIASDTPLKMKAQRTFAEVPDPYILIVVGGGDAAYQAIQDPALMEYVRSAGRSAELVVSFSTGALILGAAGFLQYQPATTHWAYGDKLAEYGARYERQPWIEAGKIFTGAGASAAVDLSLLLIERLLGLKIARQVQITAEWDPKPPFGGIDWSKVNGNPPDPPATPVSGSEKRIALIIYRGLTVFDLAGPLEMVSVLARLRPEFKPLVVAEKVEPVTSDTGLTFMPNALFSEVPTPDVLIVPGGGQPTLKLMSNLAIRQYIRNADQSTRYTTSVCTGALLLASVGLLEGKDATTHWGYTRFLEKFGACYRRQRWVAQGKTINSAGVSAGIDMSLYLIAQLTDEQTARQVQLAVQYDPHPPFGDIDYDHLPGMLKLARAYTGLLMPVYTRKPRRLLRQGL
jgi:transcriptional regulator GlxA family with amidase domain